MKKQVENFKILKDFLTIDEKSLSHHSILKHKAKYAIVNKYDWLIMFSWDLNLIDISTASDDNFVLTLTNELFNDINYKYIDYYKWVLIVYSLEKDFTLVLRLMEEWITVLNGDPFDIKNLKEFNFYEE